MANFSFYNIVSRNHNQNHTNILFDMFLLPNCMHQIHNRSGCCTLHRSLLELYMFSFDHIHRDNFQTYNQHHRCILRQHQVLLHKRMANFSFYNIVSRNHNQNHTNILFDMFLLPNCMHQIHNRSGCCTLPRSLLELYMFSFDHIHRDSVQIYNQHHSCILPQPQV